MPVCRWFLQQGQARCLFYFYGMKPLCRTAAPNEVGAVADVILSANPQIEARIKNFLARGARWHDATPVVCEVDGRIVSSACIFHRQVLVEEKPKPVAIIGAVATRPEARGQGLATRVLTHCEELIRERGYPQAILFCSIIEFYQRFGWAVVEEDFVEFELSSARPRTGTYTIAAVNLTAIPAPLRALADSAIVRTDEVWQEYADWQRADADLFWAASNRDEFVAYVRSRREGRAIRLMDAACRPEAADALGLLLHRQHEMAGVECFRTFLPRESRLARSLADAGVVCFWRKTDVASGVMMMKPMTGDLRWSPHPWWAVDRV